MTFRDVLANSPALYPIAVEPVRDLVQFVQLSESDYSNASFHDPRMLPQGYAHHWIAWRDLRSLAAALPRRCHFIFHISHCGSTLLSRLLGACPSVFALREPAILRTFAQPSIWNEHEFQDRLNCYLGLWSRVDRPGRTAVIKATSIISERAALLLNTIPTARAILMYVPLKTFLQAMLDGAYSDITSHANDRHLRLQQRLQVELPPATKLSPGECVAMSWLCEMLSLLEAHICHAGRTFWLDFDRFLENSDRGLHAALTHFGFMNDLDRIPAILSGPELQHYAKHPAQSYDARFRESLLEQSMHKHAEEIQKGLAWFARIEELHAPISALSNALESSNW